MKQLLIFILLIICSVWIDVSPVSLDEIRGDSIHVNVEGAVENPGEIELPLYATVKDALEEAVPSDNADVSVINPAQILKEHDVLVVPEKKADAETQRISINTADSDALCTLPGIGESTADAIITYRDQNGLFQSLDEIMNVKGIGEAKYEKIKDLITL